MQSLGLVHTGITAVGADFYFDLVTALWLGFSGACVGSFLNVVAYRMPLGMSVVWKPSHCPHCGHAIRARDNVPVLGWIALGGKCRDCKSQISPRYAIVEAVIGGVFFVLAFVELFTAGANLPGGPFAELAGAFNVVWNPNWQIIGLYLYHCLLMSLLTVMVLFDLDRNPLPRSFVWFAIAVICLSSVSFPFLYPDRYSVSGDSRLAAVVDAMTGAALFSFLGFAVWGFVRFATMRTKDSNVARNSVRYSFALAFAALTVGGFLGRRAAMMLLLLWALGMVVTRLANRFIHGYRVSVLPSLWLATLILILFWRPLLEALPLR